MVNFYLVQVYIFPSRKHNVDPEKLTVGRVYHRPYYGSNNIVPV